MLEQNSSSTDTAPWSIRQTILGLVLTLIPWMVVSLYLVGQGAKSASPVRLPPAKDAADAIFVFFFSSFIEAAFLIAPLYVASRVVSRAEEKAHRHSIFYALGLRKFNVPQSLVFVIGLFILFVLINNLYQDIILFFHLNLQTNDQVILQESKQAPISTYATLVVSVLVAPFCEEMFFRGFVFMGLLRAMPVWAAMLLSAFLFALAHVDPGSFVVLFFIGIALAFVRWRTQSLWPSVLLHLLNNAIGVVLILLIMRGAVR